MDAELYPGPAGLLTDPTCASPSLNQKLKTTPSGKSPWTESIFARFQGIGVYPETSVAAPGCPMESTSCFRILTWTEAKSTLSRAHSAFQQDRSAGVDSWSNLGLSAFSKHGWEETFFYRLATSNRAHPLRPWTQTLRSLSIGDFDRRSILHKRWSVGCLHAVSGRESLAFAS